MSGPTRPQVLRAAVHHLVDRLRQRRLVAVAEGLERGLGGVRAGLELVMGALKTLSLVPEVGGLRLRVRELALLVLDLLLGVRDLTVRVRGRALLAEKQEEKQARGERKHRHEHAQDDGRRLLRTVRHAGWRPGGGDWLEHLRLPPSARPRTHRPCPGTPASPSVSSPGTATVTGMFRTGTKLGRPEERLVQDEPASLTSS